MNKAKLWRQSSVEVLRSAAGISYVVNGEHVGGPPPAGVVYFDKNSAYPASMLRDVPKGKMTVAASGATAPFVDAEWMGESTADAALRLYRKLRTSSRYGK